MRTNDVKEYCIFPEINNTLELKHSYKELQKIMQNEEYEKTRKEINERKEQEKEEKLNKLKPTKKEILNTIIYFLVISIIPIVVTVLLLVDGNENIIASFGMGFIFGFGEWLISWIYQNGIKDIKANKLSWEKMQYIPLTEGELTSLNIHNIYDYISFLNDFLTAGVEYFSFRYFEYIEIYNCAKPPKAILDEINKSLKYLDDADDAGYIDFSNDEYVYAH